MKTNLAFIVGTGAPLIGTAFVAYAIGYAQYGPGWEVPARAATQLFVAPLVALMLDVAAVGSYLLGDHFVQQSRTLRVFFWLALGASCAISICAYFAAPGQWPIRHPALSRVAPVITVPTLIACAASWLLLSLVGWNNVP